MDNEATPKQPQKRTKNERIQALEKRSWELAGTISIFVAILAAAAILIEKQFSETLRVFSAETVAFMLMGLGALNHTVACIYQVIVLKRKKRIVDAAIFGALLIFALVTVIKAL